MDNKQKYNEAFMKALEIDADKLNADLAYGMISEWDSIGHMNLITEIEETFQIQLEPDDMMKISSYNEGKTVLKQYGIQID